MVSVIEVSDSTAGHVFAGKIDTSDEDSVLLDEENAEVVDKLLDVVGAVSIKGIDGSDSDNEVTVTKDVDGKTWISFSVFHFEHNFESDGWDWVQLTHFGSRVQSVEECPTGISY
ncbi:UNVERIFIED_CONTAM: hypothetical protein NCL1_49878 [Trichonephila clavipes]